MKTDTKHQIADLHRLAFGPSEGPAIADLVIEMLDDPETLSIDAMKDGRLVGNVVFTPFFLDAHPSKRCFLLSPIGVLPEQQGQGAGTWLIDEGAQRLRELGVDAIFVLGHPKYYGSRGFSPTWVIPPFHTELRRIDAWKMMELKSGSMAEVGGTSVASSAIMKPMFWKTAGKE